MRKLTKSIGLHSGSKLLQTLIDGLYLKTRKKIRLEEDIATVRVVAQENNLSNTGRPKKAKKSNEIAFMQ